MPKDGEMRRTKEDTDEMLKKKLLGKNYKKTLQAQPHANGAKRPETSKFGRNDRDSNSHHQGLLDGHDSTEEEGEGGRSSIGRSKAEQHVRQDNVETVRGDARGVSSTETLKPTAGRGLKRGKRYLDEALEEKASNAAKKHRRKQRRQKSSDDVEA